MFTVLFRPVRFERLTVGSVSAAFAVSHSPGPGFLVCVGAGGVGSCLSSAPLFALNHSNTKAVQLADSGLSEHVTFSPYFLKMPMPGGEALRQHLIEKWLWWLPREFPQAMEQAAVGHVLLVPTPPVGASALLVQQGFASVQRAQRRCCSRDSRQRARHLYGPKALGWSVCIYKAVHDGFIFFAVLIGFLFLCSTAKSWLFLSFFCPLRAVTKRQLK